MATSIALERSQALGRELTEIALGVDALALDTARLTGNDDYEHLVPIFIGDGLVAPRDFSNWPAAHAALDELAADVFSLPDGARKTFLSEMVRSLGAWATCASGVPLSFEAKVCDIVGVPAGPVSQDEIDAIYAALDRLLSRRGISRGSLAARVETWQTGRYLEADILPEVFDELMARAKERTDALVWPTGDYTMRLNAVRNVPYAGRCSFVAGTMDINLDVLVTRSSLKHLVCHEVFPGHSTQLLSTLAVARNGEAPLDVLLCTMNAVTGAVQEGIGDQGIELIDWVEDDDDAAQIELRRLQTATGTNAAWHLHCSGWTPQRSIAYLRDVGFGQDSWAPFGRRWRCIRSAASFSHRTGSATKRSERSGKRPPSADRCMLRCSAK